MKQQLNPWSRVQEILQKLYTTRKQEKSCTTNKCIYKFFFFLCWTGNHGSWKKLVTIKFCILFFFFFSLVHFGSMLGLFTYECWCSTVNCCITPCWKSYVKPTRSFKKIKSPLFQEFRELLALLPIISCSLDPAKQLSCIAKHGENNGFSNSRATYT